MQAMASSSGALALNCEGYESDEEEPRPVTKKSKYSGAYSYKKNLRRNGKQYGPSFHQSQITLTSLDILCAQKI